MYIKICIECNNPFETKDNRSKFCSRKCSAIYNNKLRGTLSEEHKSKISASLKNWYSKNEPKSSGDKHSKAVGKSTKGKFKKPESILEVSKRTTSKILKRLNFSCSNCNWNEEVCDIHHIKPKEFGGTDEHTNLSYLCPNCHRKAQKGLLKNIINLQEQIGDKWKEYYYG